MKSKLLTFLLIGASLNAAPLPAFCQTNVVIVVPSQSTAQNLPLRDMTLRALPSDIKVEVVNDENRPSPFAPYETVSVDLIFAHPERYRDVLDTHLQDVQISSLSRINGKPFPSYYLDNMSYGSWCDDDASKAREGVVFSQGFGPVGLLPRQPGTYRMSLVLKTSLGLWRVPPFNVVIQVPQRERVVYCAFLQSGAKTFLDSDKGARTIDDARASRQPLPYASIEAFVKRYKTSVFTHRVLDRAKECWLNDAGGAIPTVEEDNRHIAKIIALIDAKSVLREATTIRNDATARLKKATPQEKANLQLQIAGHERWIKMIRAAQKS